MSYKSSLLVILIILLSACNMRPLNVLNDKKMVEVLVDVHLTEAAVSNKIPYVENDDKRAFYNNMLEKHGVSREEFDRSLKWYARNPKKYEPIYQQVVDSLSRMKEDVKNNKFHPYLNNPFYCTDSLDLWLRGKSFEAKGTKTQDSLSFVYDDERLFINYDRIQLKFSQKIVNPDSLAHAKTILIVHYSDSISDTISTDIVNDTLRRHYKLTAKGRKDSKPLMVEGIFYSDSIRKQSIQVDNISLNRCYNGSLFPNTSTMSFVLDSLKGVKSIKAAKKYKDRRNNNTLTPSVTNKIIGPK